MKHGPTQISETASPHHAPGAADFHRSDYVPAADGHRYLAT